MTKASHQSPATGTTPGNGQRPRLPDGSHRWHLRVDDDGQLTAMLAGSEPPVTVSGDSLASLRRQIRDVTLRGVL